MTTYKTIEKDGVKYDLRDDGIYQLVDKSYVKVAEPLMSEVIESPSVVLDELKQKLDEASKRRTVLTVESIDIMNSVRNGDATEDDVDVKQNEIDNTEKEIELYQKQIALIERDDIDIINSSIVKYNELKDEYDIIKSEWEKEDRKEKAEKAIQKMLDDKAKSMGYDGIDAISKYFRPTSKYYAECIALGEWVDDCWTTYISIQDDELSVDEVLNQMPKGEF